MGFLKMLFKPVTLIIGKLFKRGKAEDAEKQLTDEQKSKSPLMNTLIHSPGAALKFLKDKAAAISKGTRTIGSQASEDVRQQGQQQYNEEAAEKEGIIVKTTQSFKDRLNSGKIRALKSIDEAFRFSGRKSKYDASKTLMQNAGGDSFKATPMQRSRNAARVNLPTGKAQSAVNRANITIKSSGNTDPSGKAVSDAINSTIKSHFEASKQAQASAAEVIIEATSASNKNITENLQKVLEATQESNANINQNLSEMYGVIQRNSTKSGKQMADGISSSGQMLDESVSNYIKQSDEASNQSFKALSEQLYDNEVSFADSHKEEMTLLGKTKSGLNQLIEMVNTQRNATLAAGAAIQGLESKIAEVTQAPARWGDRLNQLIEGLQEAAGTMLGQVLGYSYLLGGTLMSAGRVLLTKLSNVEFSLPGVVSGKTKLGYGLSLPFEVKNDALKIKPFDMLGGVSSFLLEKSKSIFSGVLNSSHLGDIIPKEIKEKAFQLVDPNSKVSYSKSISSLQKDISADSEKEDNSNKVLSKYNEQRKNSKTLELLAKQQSDGDDNVKSFSTGIANMGYNQDLIKKAISLKGTDKNNLARETIDKIISDDTELNKLQKSYISKTTNALITEPVKGSIVALQGINTRAGLFEAFMSFLRNHYTKSSTGDKFFNSALKLFVRLVDIADIDVVAYFFAAFARILQERPEYSNQDYLMKNREKFFKTLVDYFTFFTGDRGTANKLKHIFDSGNAKSEIRDFIDKFSSNPDALYDYIILFLDKYSNFENTKEFKSFIKELYNKNLSNSDTIEGAEKQDIETTSDLSSFGTPTYSFSNKDADDSALKVASSNINTSRNKQMKTRVKNAKVDKLVTPDKKNKKFSLGNLLIQGALTDPYHDAPISGYKQLENVAEVVVTDDELEKTDPDLAKQSKVLKEKERYLGLINSFRIAVNNKEWGFQKFNLNDYDLDNLKDRLIKFYTSSGTFLEDKSSKFYDSDLVTAVNRLLRDVESGRRESSAHFQSEWNMHLDAASETARNLPKYLLSDAAAAADALYAGFNERPYPIFVVKTHADSKIAAQFTGNTLIAE